MFNIKDNFDQKKGKLILGVIAVSIIIIFLILVFYFAISKDDIKNDPKNNTDVDNITTTKIATFDTSKITTNKIYDVYGNECIEIYYDNNKLNLGLSSDIPIYAVRDIKALENIGIFNVAYGSDGVMLVIIDKMGNIINSYTGKEMFAQKSTKLKGSIYRGKYSINNNKIYISSDNGGQDASSICDDNSNSIVQFVEVLTYKNNKLSGIKLSSSMKAKEYIEKNNINCSSYKK